MWSSGRLRKLSLHSGQRHALPRVSQYDVMQERQKLWPHGVDTGLVKTSRQMEQENCSSDRKSTGTDIVWIDID